jgi:hypothetical protein
LKITKFEMQSFANKGGGETMKKLIVIGIVMVMVMGLAVAASAVPAPAWTILIKAAQISGYNGTGAVPTTPTFLNAFQQAQISVVTSGAAVTASAAAFQVAQSGIDFGVATAGKRNSTSKVLALPTLTWNMTLETGASFATNPVTLGWYVPNLASSFAGWTVKASNGTDTFNLIENGLYSTTGVAGSFQAISTQTLSASASQAWTFTATSVPEPGSMVALFSGLIGLVGFGIRRRK